MNKTALVIALAGLTTAAVAEDFILSIAGAPATIDATNGAVFTIDVIGDATIGTHIAAGVFGLSSGSNSMITNIQWTPDPMYAFVTDEGYDGEGNNGLVVVGNIFNLPCILGDGDGDGDDDPLMDLLLGSAIGQFQITLAPGSFGELNLDLIAGPTFSPNIAFSMQAVTPNYDDIFEIWPLFDDGMPGGNLILNGASINVVPAPSALALLGFSGFAATRRNRKTS